MIHYYKKQSSFSPSSLHIKSNPLSIIWNILNIFFFWDIFSLYRTWWLSAHGYPPVSAYWVLGRITGLCHQAQSASYQVNIKSLVSFCCPIYFYSDYCVQPICELFIHDKRYIFYYCVYFPTSFFKARVYCFLICFMWNF